MPAFFLELFSEEIPARMQARGADSLALGLLDVLAPIGPRDTRVFFGPRRIAFAADVSAETPALSVRERGPRVSAPEQALAGFLRKHGALRESLVQDGDFWMVEKTVAARGAAELIASTLPALLRRFAWPKSMRWGGSSGFAWVRPLRRIVCLLDGAVVPFALAQGEDDGHGLVADDLTEGHRSSGAAPLRVDGVAGWAAGLRGRQVIVDAAERAALIRDGIARLAADKGLRVVDDAGLVDEVAGLVEWPVPLLGRIDDAFMDLPPEVMQVSMRVNQRYFALRGADGRAAPWFGFAANVAAADGGAAIVAGNERVLRARFADARHFWDLDRRTKLADRVGALEGVVFHAELGTQAARVQRIVRLAGVLAPLVGADVALAERAALLCKADLTTGMVGEFPELQGVMGGYYAAHDGEDAAVAAAVREHYAPKGVGDGVPQAPVSIAVALADKLDQIVAFFAIGQAPTGSGDPFALRRAALGVIRIIRTHELGFDLAGVLRVAVAETPRPEHDDAHEWSAVLQQIETFLFDRLRVQIRAEDGRADLLTAALAATAYGVRFDVLDLVRRAASIGRMIETDDGRNLLAAYKRAANILKIESKRGANIDDPFSAGVFSDEAEQQLAGALQSVNDRSRLVSADDFEQAVSILATLRSPLDAFFDAVMVNDPDAAVRENRLRLLNNVKRTIDDLADLSQIES